MNKAELQSLLLTKLETERLQQRNAAHLSRDEATSEESRAENKYDTRGQEAAYLAEGQARLAAELEASFIILRNFKFQSFAPDALIAVGALVSTKVENEKTHSWYLLSPAAGGNELEIDGLKILVVTAASPIGRKLLGRRAGDKLPSGNPTSAKPIQIISVA